ncbi:MAG: hypothetical protein GYA39_01265 [Methanothrix sp.]|nr:hypothetical protein [Methanothrix sp.]
MKAFLPKHKLPLLLEALRGQMEVIAPVSTDAGPAFVTWQGQPIDLMGKPLSPVTEFLLPHKEALFTYVQEAGRYTFKEEMIPSRLLFGIRPCDLHAIALLDRIFGREPPDQAYFRRRRATALVVQNCTSPGKECFCVGLEAGPEAKDPCDLQLTDIGDGFLCQAETPVGILILNAGRVLLQPALPEHFQEKTKLLQEARRAMPRDRSCSQIRQAMQRADWEALGRECLSCGGCSFVCPVCHCFNILDLGVPDGQRLRCRDSCILSGFSRLTGGANPRRTPGQRLRHWYQEKFEDIPQITGLTGCVGCGRCHLTCPAAINRVDLSVVSRLMGDGSEARR